MKAPSVNAKTFPDTITLPARRLVAAPVNWVGVALEEVITLVDDSVTLDVDTGPKVALEAGTEPSVGVSDCVGTASTKAAVKDSYTELAAASSVAVNEKVV